MKRLIILVFIAILTILINFILPDTSDAKEVIRPEEIKSKRQVIYDDETYVKLARLWKDYYDEYPSEYSYANWMYAARYAGDENYQELLSKGLEEYPSNPTLLYLKSFFGHGAHDDVEGRKYLEKAIAIDPGFVDPWFGLVIHYMDMDEDEKLNLALRRLLESGIITDEVMDYNYNVLISLDENAILITNGDNDTYPGWILTRILNQRPDVTIVNRSLLNTDWYPLYIIEQSLPRFINGAELSGLREAILEEIKKTDDCCEPGGPFGDSLILRIVESAGRAGRPVYFAKTMYITEKLEDVCEKGRDLGLVTLITPTYVPYAEQLRQVYGKWINAFRTSGMKSWRLRFDPDFSTGILRMLRILYLKRFDHILPAAGVVMRRM
jgi:hypothetical protein